MTISTPTFQRLQDGVTRADDLRVKGPINVMMAWLSGSLTTQLNTQFGAISNSISAALALFRGTANTWSAAQTIQLATTGTALTLQSTDAGAGAGPDLVLDRNSATPAASDILANVYFRGRNSIGGSIDYARFLPLILDKTNGSEDGALQLRAYEGGADTLQMTIGTGVVIGTATGGAQGNGTLNLDAALFRDGTQVVGTRVTGYGDPFGAVSRATISVTTVTTAALASFVAAMYTDLKAHGLVGN